MGPAVVQKTIPLSTIVSHGSGRQVHLPDSLHSACAGPLAVTYTSPLTQTSLPPRLGCIPVSFLVTLHTVTVPFFTPMIFKSSYFLHVQMHLHLGARQTKEVLPSPSFTVFSKQHSFDLTCNELWPGPSPAFYPGIGLLQAEAPCLGPPQDQVL